MTTTKNDAPAVLEKETAPWEGTHKAEISNVAGPSVAPTEPTEGGADPIVDAGAPGVSETDGVLMFQASDGGVFRLDAHGVTHEKDGRTTDICGPLRVDAEVRNATGEGRRLCVSFVDSDGVTHEKLFDLPSLFSRPSAIAGELASAGLEIRYPLSSQGGRPWVANYLKDFPVTQKVLGVESYGWITPGERFAMPGRVIGGNGERIEYVGDPESAPPYESRGTLEDWDREVAVFGLHSSRIAFSLCVGVAPVLMPFFPSVECAGFHFYGPSSKGKSTTARAMCSVWASARKVGRSEVRGWNQTGPSLENFAAARNCFPVVLDEISGNEESKKIAEIIYTLMNGTGKGRMTRNLTRRPTLTWRMFALSTGERTTEEQASTIRNAMPLQTGALIRMANMPACPVSESLGVFESLPDGMDDAKEVAGKIQDAVTEGCFGTAGPAFVEALITYIREEGLERICAHLQGIRDEWVRNYCDSSESEVRRVADSFSFVAAAGELAIELGVFPWPRGRASKQVGVCFKAWRSVFRTSSEQKADLCECVDDVVESLRDRFTILDLAGTVLRAEARSPALGCIVEGPQGRSVYFIPKAFTDEVCRPMRRPRAEFLEALKAEGRLRFNTPRELVFKPKRGANIDGIVPLKRAIIVTPPPEKA